MGTGIGNYIHYRINNYLKYGTNRTGTGVFNSGVMIQESKQALSQTFKKSSANGLSKQQRTDLIRRIQFLMHPSSDPKAYRIGEGTAEDYDRAFHEVVVPSLQTQFEIAATEIEREVANVRAAAPTIENLSKIKMHKHTIHAEIVQRAAVAIQAAVDKCKQVMNGEISLASTGFSKEQCKNLLSYYDELQEIYKTLGETTQKMLQSVDINNRKYTSATELALNENLVSYIKKINSLLTMGRGAAATQKGTLAEIMVPTAVSIGRYNTFEAVRDAIMQGLGLASPYGPNAVAPLAKWSGNQTTPVIVSQADVGFEFNMAEILKDEKGKLNYNHKTFRDQDLWISQNPTKDKVDVQVRFDPQSTQWYNLSVKDVSLGGATPQNIHLVSAAPLLPLLTSLQNHELVKHYLNQHVPHNYTANVWLWEETSRLVMLSVFEKAFRGYKNAEKADVFVVIDNISGAVQIINMGDLLAELSTLDMKTLSQWVVMRPDLASITFANPYSDTWVERINKLLADVQKQKMTVELHPYVIGRSLGGYVGEEL